MVAVPDATPVTTPLVFTLATAASLELHTPPTVELANVVLDPTHTLDTPVFALLLDIGLIKGSNSVRLDITISL